VVARGPVVLIPASSIAASLLTAAIFFWCARRYRALPPLTTTLLLLLYLSNYVYLVTMGMFYRSSKPLLAPILMGTTFYVLSLLGEDSPSAAGRADKRPALVVFGLFCLMSLLDRQGFFFALAGLAVLLYHAVLAHRRDLALAAAAAVVAMTAYNVALAPFIVERLNGYAPSLEFQRLPVSQLLSDPSYFTRAGVLLVQASALLMGDVSPWLGLVLLVLLVALAVRRRAQSAKPPVIPTVHTVPGVWNRRTISLMCAIVAVAQVSMFAGMIARHPPLWEHFDHRLWYYPLPFQALLVTMMVASLAQIVAGWGVVRMAVLNVILAAGVVNNAVQGDDYSRLQRQSQWFSTVYSQTYILKRSLSDGRPYSTHPGYLAFYRYCLTLSPPLRARAEAAAGSVWRYHNLPLPSGEGVRRARPETLRAHGDDQFNVQSATAERSFTNTR
jgi:hypothetical protein